MIQFRFSLNETQIINIYDMLQDILNKTCLVKKKKKRNMAAIRSPALESFWMSHILIYQLKSDKNIH